MSSPTHFSRPHISVPSVSTKREEGTFTMPPNNVERMRSQQTWCLSYFYMVYVHFKAQTECYRTVISGARFGSTYTKIGTIREDEQWSQHEDSVQIREAFQGDSLAKPGSVKGLLLSSSKKPCAALDRGSASAGK